MTRTLWVALGLLCAWGFITIVRNLSEGKTPEQLRDAGARNPDDGVSLEDSIDWDELNKAEDEVRDIDPQARPEDGFEGDDWGPGSARKPPSA